MKVFIIGANGRQGSVLVKEALKNHHEVTAVVKEELKESHGGRVKALKKDLYDLTREDLHHADVVIDAFGVFEPDKLHLHQSSLEHLTNLLSGTPTRLIVVGGAGSLYVDKHKTKKFIDAPEFPKAYVPLATHMSLAYDKLKKNKDVKWTYVSPPLVFDPTKPGTGHYTLGGDHVIYNKRGESYITYEDYAKAVIDEIKNKKYINKRFTVVGE